MQFAELETTIKQYMLLKDKHIVRLLCAFMVSRQMPINPPWLFVVGAPSSGKSKLLKALEGLEHVEPLDELTPSTFASGMKGKNGESNSLLDRLPLFGAVILFKDFTTIISKDDESRGMVIGQLRKIYDGDFVKKTGSGVDTTWHGRLAVLAGVTESIYPAMYKMADMGERFLMYELDAFNKQERKDVGHMAADQLDDAPGDKAIKEAFTEFISGLKVPKTVGAIDQETKNQIVDLAELITKARTPIQRDKYGKNKPITQIPEPESTPRFIKQILGLALGLQVINENEGYGPILTSQDRMLLHKLALNCIPAARRKCLRALTRYGGGVETRGLAQQLGYDTESIRVHLYDLAALKVIDREGEHRDRWFIKTDYRDIISQYEGIEVTSEALEDPGDEEDGPPVEISAPATPEPPFGDKPKDLIQAALEILPDSELIN